MENWNPKFTPEQVRLLEYGLVDAQNYYLQLKGINDTGMTFKEVKDEVQRMHNALIKLTTGKGTKVAALKSILATSHAITDEAAKQIDIFIDDLRRPEPVFFKQLVTKLVAKPDDLDLANRLIDATAKFLTDLKTPGKGGAKKDARKFIMPLQKLAQHFNETIPDRAISADDSTLFYEYCTAWFEKYHPEVKDPKRHIKNMIEDLSHWKIIPLSSSQ